MGSDAGMIASEEPCHVCGTRDRNRIHGRAARVVCIGHSQVSPAYLDAAKEQHRRGGRTEWDVIEGMEQDQGGFGPSTDYSGTASGLGITQRVRLEDC